MWGGYEHIVGTDSNYEGLLRLQEKIDDKTKKNVFLIKCNALDLPFKSNSFDFVLAIEILYYLNEKYNIGVKECHRILKRKSHFLESEPSRMGMFLWSVVEGNLKNAFKIYEEHLFKEIFNHNFVFLRVFTSKEIESIHGSIGLQVIEKKGTSLIPIMLSSAYRHGHISDAVSKKELRKIEQICNKSSEEEAYYRCIVFYSIKT